MILIDTDILIWLLMGDVAIKNEIESLLASHEKKLMLTPVQIAEIYAGIREKERIATNLFLGSLFCCEISREIGSIAGEYMRLYGKSHGVVLADSLVAACASFYGAALWTLNHKHYPMIDSQYLYRHKS